MQLCAFRVAGVAYALDIHRIEEVLPPQPLRPLSQPAAPFDGAIQLRGELLPLVDLRRLLAGIPPPPAEGRLLVCLLATRRIALAVDGVTGVLRVRRGALQPLAATDRPRSPYVIGSCPQDARWIWLLDVKALLRASAAPAGEISR